MKIKSENLNKIIELEAKRKVLYRRASLFEQELIKHKEISVSVANGGLKKLKAEKVALETELLAGENPELNERFNKVLESIVLMESSGPETIRELSAKCTQARSEAQVIEGLIRDQQVEIAKSANANLNAEELLKNLATLTFKNKLAGDISNDGIERLIKQELFGKDQAVKVLAPYWEALKSEIHGAVQKQMGSNS